MLTDHDLRVRAIRRRSRIDALLSHFVLNGPCRWTKAGRSALARWRRVWPRVRNECAMASGLNDFFVTMGVPYESAAEAHVTGCRCRHCPRTPKRRARLALRASGTREGGGA